MKRLVLIGFLGLATAPALWAQQNTFFWSGTHTFVETNDPPPTIDANNFVVANGATFGVDLTLLNEQLALQLGDLSATILYQTSDTLNYTNSGVLLGIPGFDFEYYPDVPPPPKPGVPFSNRAGVFANIADGFGGGAILCTNIGLGANPFTPNSFTPSDITGLAMLRINATNIIDTGLIGMDSTGLIDLRGDNVDLRRGTFSMTQGSAAYNIVDWGSGGFGTNTAQWSPATQLTPTSASSPLFITAAGLIQQMVLNKSTPYFESLTGTLNGTTIIWRGIFLQDSSPANVTHNVYFGGGDPILGPGAFTIEWIGTNADPVTGERFPTYLYLNDVPEDRRLTNFSFAVPPIIPLNIADFTLTQSAVQLQAGALTPPGYVNIWPSPVSNDFSFINLQLTPTAATNEISGGSPTNVPGRIQISADQSLNLANTRMSGQNYTLLSSPAAFLGNSNAVISSPMSDLNLGGTNGILVISNLLNPVVPLWTGVPVAPTAVGEAMGGIQAWSGSFLFTNMVTIGTNPPITVTNDVRILLVNSAIEPGGPAYQQNVQFNKAGNDLVISDPLNIFGSFSSDTQVLTITTNGPGAFSPDGQLNLLTPDIFWSTSLPNLQYFTNAGEVDSQNLTVFAGGLASPYDDPNSATPYQAFINQGIITNQGTFIRSDYFQNTGVIVDEPGGSLDIVVGNGSANFPTALATNGLFLAPGGYVSISANSLLASNGVIDAGGGPLILNIPCSLSDGYVLGNEFGLVTNSSLPPVVTNGNIWVTSGGIQIPVKPPTADLLATTITNLAFNNFVSQNVWPGADLGVNPQGFGTNLAVGRLILNADPSSVFNFQGANGNKNAIYVDRLVLEGNTTNVDPHGNPLSVAIQPGMNIYYAQAIENGASVAEKINGHFGADNVNGGRFLWVSNYAGVYSSTNIHYVSDGNTYIFNEALAISPDIASGGPDGSNTNKANIDNPEPIPTNLTFAITVLPPQPCQGGGGTQPGPTNPPITPPVPIATQLQFPVENAGGNKTNNGAGGGAGVSFGAAQGSYNGLFYEINGVNPAHAGSFTASVTSKGSYSAKIQLGKGNYTFSGLFGTNGETQAIVSGKGLTALNVDLNLVNNDEITGSISGNNYGWTAQLQAEQAPFSSKKPTVLAGKKTLLLPSDPTNSTSAAGDGFGALTVNTSGGVQWSGTLPDGTRISEKSALSKDGFWPVYSSLYNSAGVFIGWMQCTNNGKSDLGGSALWIAPPGSSSLYPGGITNRLDATGSQVSGLVGFDQGAAILSGAALQSSLTNSVTVFGKNIESGNKTLKLSVNPQTGLFNGSVKDPNSGQTILFEGALLERSGVGGGFFLNADQSGKVYLGAAN